MRVGEAVVDGGEAGGAGVAGEGGLDGGGFGLDGEDAEAVARGVEGEVYENVNVIGCDQLSGLGVGEVVDVAPGGEGAEAGGEVVVSRRVGVAVDLKLRMVVVFEEGKDVMSDDVMAEVGRDVADFEGAGGG